MRGARRRRPWSELALLAGIVVGSSGCRGCNDDTAYSPFGVASEIPVASASAAPVAPSASAGFAEKKDLLAPPNARRWKIGELDATLPEGRLFERALAADFDGDGKQDAVAWTVPAPKAAPAPGAPAPSEELVYFPAVGQPKSLLTLPGFLPTGPGCKTNVELRQTGPRTLVVDAGATCVGTALLARAPVRSLTVVAPAGSRPIVVAVRVADPAPGESLDLDVDSSDRDGDGRDDVVIRLSIGKLGTPPATAAFAWLDRAAGPARDALEPRQSFETAATALASRARNKRTRGDVAAAVANVRRTFSGACAESGTARVFDGDGAPLRCGDLGGSFDRLAEAEVEANVGAGDAFAAFGALARADWFRAPLSKSVRDKLAQRIAKAVTVLDVTDAPGVKAEVAVRSGPRLSPLSFEPDGSLLIQSAGNVVRLASDGRSETVEPPAPIPAAGGQGPASTAVVQAWPLAMRSNTGLGWAGTTLSCDRSEISLSIADARGGLRSQPTDLLAPRPGACAGGAQPNVTSAPVAWHGDELVAVIGGTLIGPRPNFAAPETLSARGTALSPDGRWLVAVTPVGVVVTGAKTELWHVDKALGSVDAVRDLGDCVVANEARAVACVQGRKVRFFARP